MRRIIKDATPDFWRSYIRKHPKVRYDSLDKTESGQLLRKQIREHMLRQQKMICCYCCGSIDLSNSHNEHIKPKSRFPADSMKYGNLLVSCCTSDTCGMAKEDNYDVLKFVSPTVGNCEEHFLFLPDGRVADATDEGKYTVDLLKLNTYSLVQARKQLYRDCCETARYAEKEFVLAEYIQEKDGCLPRFVDMVAYFYKRGDFDSGICK